MFAGKFRTAEQRFQMDVLLDCGMNFMKEQTSGREEGGDFVLER